MAMQAPNRRKYLSADGLLDVLRGGFADMADHRPGKPDMSLTDALLSALAMVSLQSPSLLAFDQDRTEGNWQRVYGIERVPCDTAMRARLDPVEPESLRPRCKGVFRALQRGKALEEMVCVEGHSLLALDGTGYFSSPQIHCESCWETHHRHGPVTYGHQRLGAARMHPDRRAVIPLMPEPMIQQDGTDKNDGERHAAKRCMVRLRQDHPHLQLIVTEDSLSSHAPHIQVLQEHHLPSILGVQEGDHAYVFEQVEAAEQAGRVLYDDRDDAETGLHHRLRFVSDVPLNESHADLRVNCLECWEWDKAKDQVQHLSWVTDLRVHKGTGYQLMRGGRARWRMENATFNTLKNPGDHFAHNFGHGYQHLSGVVAVLMMLAFVVDQVQQMCGPLFQAVWAKLGRKRRLWEKMRALFYPYALESMKHLCDALLDGWKKTAPVFALDASSSPWMWVGNDHRLRETTPCRRRGATP